MNEEEIFVGLPSGVRVDTLIWKDSQHVFWTVLSSPLEQILPHPSTNSPAKSSIVVCQIFWHKLQTPLKFFNFYYYYFYFFNNFLFIFFNFFCKAHQFFELSTNFTISYVTFREKYIVSNSPWNGLTKSCLLFFNFSKNIVEIDLIISRVFAFYWIT
jgi:hypothetical protein